MEYANFRIVLPRDWGRVGCQGGQKVDLSCIYCIYLNRFSKSEKRHRKMLRYVKYHLYIMNV